MFRHGNSQSLSMDNPSHCLCSYVRGTGHTISFMGEAPWAEECGEETSYHRTACSVHDHPSCSCTLHTNGRWPTPGVMPYSPPCIFPPIRRHDAHSHFDDRGSLHTNPLPHIWGVPPASCGVHPGPLYTSPTASHQMPSTCGCGTQCLTHSPRILQTNSTGDSPQAPSRSYSTRSLHSHSALANPQPGLVGHSPTRASPSTIVTSPSSPPPSMTRSHTPPSHWDDSETTAEADGEKLPPGG